MKRFSNAIKFTMLRFSATDSKERTDNPPVSLHFQAALRVQALPQTASQNDLTLIRLEVQMFISSIHSVSVSLYKLLGIFMAEH